MRNRRFAVLFLSVFLVVTYFSSGSSLSQTSPRPKVYLIPIHDEVELGLLAFIKRGLKEASVNKASLVVFEISTFGGRVDAAVAIRDLILDSKIPTLAFINKRAISAGALISIACTKIYMNEGGTIGAATPIQVGGGEAKPVEAKVVSYFASEMRATAEKNNRPGDIAAAMVDADIEIKGLKTKGAPLTLTTNKAIEVRIADGLAHTVSEAVQASGIVPSGYQIIELKPAWAEKISRFVTSSVVSPLLITIGVILLFVEIKTGGFGLAAIGSILAFGLYFFGHMIANLAGLEEILLFLAGIILIIVEMFLVPGFGVFGISGLLILIVALVLTGIPQNVPLSLDMPWLADAIQRLAIALVLSILGIALLLRFGPRSKIGHALYLKDTVPPVPPTADTAQAKELVGKKGVTFTDLRPAGKVIIDGRKIDVVTQGDYIDRNQPIEICEIDGSRIVVRKA